MNYKISSLLEELINWEKDFADKVHLETPSGLFLGLNLNEKNGYWQSCRFGCCSDNKDNTHVF